ncbi:MAG: ComEC/Rec2 family competence protein [Anaerolineales bacterium]
MTLFYLCTSFLAGIALAPLAGLPLVSSLGSGALFFLFAFTIKKFRIPFFCLAFFLLGSARLAAAQPKPGPNFLGSYVNQSAALEVELEEDPVPQGRGLRVRARVDRIARPEGDVSGLDGTLLVEFREWPEGWTPRYGDRVRLSGLLQPPPIVKGFDYAAYLARQGVYAVLSDPVVKSVENRRGDPLMEALYSFRRRALEILKQLFPEPEGALLSGILLGDDNSIPKDLQQAFAQTGTSHIVAISGFNISIVAGVFLALTRRLPRRIPGWLVAAAGIAIYTVLVGATPSVVRAAIMGGLAIVARQIGRRSHGLTSLFFAGTLMTAANPWTLWDVGFQLSFAATLGLILYADPLQAGVERLLSRIGRERARTLASAAGEIFLMTTAAQIATIPIMLYQFQSLSLIAFAVNPLILFVQPMLMIAGGAAVLAGMVWLPAGQALAWAGWAPTAYTIRVVEWGARIAAGWWPVDAISPAWIIVYYATLFGFTVLAVRGKLPRLDFGRTLITKVASAAIPFLAAAVFIAWGVLFRLPDGRLHLTILDTGGETILLRSPAGKTVLIDAGGDDPNRVISGLGKILGFGPQTLDWVVVGSSAEETTSALADVAACYHISNVLIPSGADREAKSLTGFLSDCEQKTIPIYEGSEGYRLDLGSGARLRVLAQGGRGLVLAVERDHLTTAGGTGVRWLILDGLDEELGQRMISQGKVPAAQVVLFPPDVKQTGNLTEWLRATHLQAGLWPFSGDLGWPPEIELLRSDSYGWLDLATDGRQMWIRVEK